MDGASRAQPQLPAVRPGRLNCRLCDAEVDFAFRATIMSKYEIVYFRCRLCHSLQTEPPYWLDEAYHSHLGHLDLGSVQRNLTNRATCYLVSRLSGLKNAVDYGGGDGLLCRMVRDYGVNCFVQDKYGSPTYAQTFTQPDFDTPELMFSFEVWEHFANPAKELEEIFAERPSIVLASTGIYEGQDNTWNYLSLPSGRHIFFYSRRGVELIANRFGYACSISGQYLLFIRPEVARTFPLRIFKLMTGRIPGRLLRAYMAIKRPYGVAADAKRLRCGN